MRVNTRILFLSFICFLSCRTLPIAKESGNASSKLDDLMLEQVYKYADREHRALIGRSTSLDRGCNSKIMPSYGLGRAKWSFNFHKYMYFERLNFTQNDTLVKAFYYVKEKNIMYRCSNTFTDSTMMNSDIEELPYDPNHWGLKIIQGDSSLLEPNTKYLITQIKRIARANWEVKAWVLPIVAKK